MQATIDAAGRIVIPKEVRDWLGLTGVHEVDIREVDGRIEIEPRSAPMSLRRGPGGVAAVSAEARPPLTDDLVCETLERLRR